MNNLFFDHSKWDDEADREVAAVSWEKTPLTSERNRKFLNHEKKSRKNISEVSKKLSMSAPILTMPDEPEKEQDPILYSCADCEFLCSEVAFMRAHRYSLKY